MLELTANCLYAFAICAHIAIAYARGRPHLSRIAFCIVKELYIVNIAHEAAGELRIEVITRLLDDIGPIYCEQYLLNLGQVGVKCSD